MFSCAFKKELVADDTAIPPPAPRASIAKRSSRNRGSEASMFVSRREFQPAFLDLQWETGACVDGVDGLECRAPSVKCLVTDP